MNISKEQLNKIQKDHFYSDLFTLFGLEYIVESGFFFDEVDDNFSLDDSLMIPCTPLLNISKPKTEKYCVLITSGAMCPIHQGHIDMMVSAKCEAERNGYEVIGGYISPDHDNYVKRKTGEYHISAEQRVLLTSNIIHQNDQSDWLSVDPWYSLFTPSDMNFTDLIIRTKKYIEKFKNITPDIFYVFGEDRWSFSSTFLLEGNCIVVGRPGYESKITTSGRILYAHSNNTSSSTSLRNKEQYKDLKFNRVNSAKIRVGEEKYFDGWSKYYNKISRVLISDQMKEFEKINSICDIISLDPMLRSENYLQVSRNFDLFGHNKSGYYIRGDISKIDKTREYVIFDDDIYTGGTMKYSIDFLHRHGINVAAQHALSVKVEDCEIQDNRDVIMFEENSGLMIEIAGHHVRAPYFYPFVDPMIRCSIDNPYQFSIDACKFNLDLYKDSNLKLSDLGYLTIYEVIGFDRETKLIDIVKFYYDYLIDLRK